jgi:hypothetical protein
MKPPTIYLKSRDRHVVAKKTGSGWHDYSAVTYSNRTQAYAKAAELGDNWEVIRFGRPFLVAWKVGAPL